MTSVLIPPSIKDPVLRRTLDQIVLALGAGGSGNIDVQDADPGINDAGSTGDIIYATGTDSIWVFNGTQWDRASSGTDGTTVQIQPFEADSAFNGNDAALWTRGSSEIKNDSGTIGLAARVYVGALEWSSDQYDAATYRWVKSGSNTTFVANSSIQVSQSGSAARRLVVNQDDISDGGSDAFFCEVTF